MKSKYQKFIDKLNETFPECCFRGEYKFHPKRNWHIDIVLKCCKFAIEIEGGATAGPGHRNIGKFLKDIEKYNEAAILGWRIMRIRPVETRNDKILDKIREYLYNNPCQHSRLNLQLRMVFYDPKSSQEIGEADF